MNGLARTLYLALDRRDQAVQEIRTLAPPVPAEDAEDSRARARASGDGPVASTFDVVMPNLAPQLADELQAIEGTEDDATDLTTGGRRLLTAAAKQIRQTKLTVDRYWPPVPTED